MGAESKKATIKFAGDDLFIGLTPSGHALTFDTDTSYKVEVSGERRDDHPRSFKSMKVHHILKGFSLSATAVAQAIELSETKYCSVAATLRPTVEIHSTFETIEDTD